MVPVFEKLATVFVTELYYLIFQSWVVNAMYKNSLTHFICHRKHTVSVEKTVWLVLFGNTGSGYCVIHAEYVSTLSGQNAESLRC